MSGFPCSFSRFHSELCGKYNKHQNDNESIKLVDCNRDVDQHLKYLKLYTVSQGDIKTEADLICRRAGLSNTDLSLFVCPFHRAKLGVYFQRGNSCKHPRHSGKGKLFRSISTAQSQHIFQECGIFIPVGSGVCYKCYGSLPKSLAESGLDVSTSTYTAEVSRDQNLLHVHSDYGDMEISVEPDTCIEDHFDATPLETGTSPSCFDKDSCTESDVGILSENSSQISSWSVEEREQDIPLENINTALDLLSNGKFSPMKFKFKSKISTLHPSSRRMLKRKATTAIQTLLNSIAPGQADDVLELVNSNVKNDLPVTSDLTNTIVKLYQNTSDCNMKKQLLSLLAKDHTKKELQKIIPGVTVYSIDQARLHASVHGKGVQVPKQPKQYRQRMDQGKLAHALDFFFNPLFHQVSSYGTKEMTLDSGEKVVIPEVVRTLCHANLVQMYDTFCEETGFTPLSKSSLFQILRICPASKRTSLRGLDNVAVDGASAFETLNEVIKQLKTSFTQQEDEDNLDKIMLDLGAFKLYLKTDFRLHASLSDRCPDHCISFALSDSSNAALHSPCTHDHDMLCDRCELFPKLILNLKRAASENEEIPADKLGELLNDIEQSETSIMSWKQHIIRCSNQDRCRLDLIDGLKTDEVLVIMDWAMKFLPLSFREKQSEWFAQKGMNWHICVCVYKFEDNTIQHRTYAHLFDQVKQDWFAVVSILEHTLKTLKNQLPVIKSAYLRSDNAGCYHCGNTWLSLDGISKRTGIQIRRYDFSEAQDGKSYCDAKIAHLRSKMRQYVASGNDIKSAADMKTAIDAFGGVKGCQTAHVEINGPKASEASTTKSTWKGITKISNLELRENQMLTWKAYSVGSGNIHSEDDLKKLWKSEISSTEIIVHSDFTPPKMVQGSIIIKKQDSVEICDEENTVEAADPSAQDTSTDIFSCLEPGCLRVFQSFSGFENHILLGNHKFVMNKCSTYDTIKNKWKESCTNIAEHSLLSRESPVVFGAPTVEMGWALKKERKNQRFTENVKVYLRGIFQAGEQTGRKANAVDVSRSMRVSRNEHGQKMFKPDEWLQPSQIASFFSRLAAQSRNPTNKHPVDDEDLETTLNFIDTLEAIEALNSVENQC